MLACGTYLQAAAANACSFCEASARLVYRGRSIEEIAMTTPFVST